MPAIITGGNFGDQIQSKAFGLSFNNATLNGTKVLEGKVEVYFPDMPDARYLHQSAVVKIKGQLHLIVFGGKSNPSTTEALKSVNKLKIHYLLQEQKPKEKELWVPCKEMNTARCLFASITSIDFRYIYAYGGITKNEQHIPTVVADNLFERYDSEENIWLSFEIKNAPRLSAFGWCQGRH